MGFSDSLKKFTGQTLMLGLGISGNKKLQGFASKVMPKEGYKDRAKSGRLDMGDLLSATGLTAPFIGMESRQAFAADPSKRNAQAALTDQFEGFKSSAYGANLGHQLGAGLFQTDDAPDAPMPGKAPAGQGAGNIQAKRQAADMARQSASRRRGLGLSGTVATSPLGLQGDGAAVSQRRLIGE